MSEHTQTRLPLINELIKLKWDKNQIQYKPEWKVPKTPSDASKRESNQSFQGFPVDVAIFDSPSNLGNYENIQIIIETKAPDVETGINQLEIYMGLSLMFYWEFGLMVLNYAEFIKPQMVLLKLSETQRYQGLGNPY